MVRRPTCQQERENVKKDLFSRNLGQSNGTRRVSEQGKNKREWTCTDNLRVMATKDNHKRIAQNVQAIHPEIILRSTDACYRRCFPPERTSTPAYNNVGHKRVITHKAPILPPQQPFSHPPPILRSKTRSSNSSNISKTRNKNSETTRRMQSCSSCRARSWSLSKRSWNKDYEYQRPSVC